MLRAAKMSDFGKVHKNPISKSVIFVKFHQNLTFCHAQSSLWAWHFGFSVILSFLAVYSRIKREITKIHDQMMPSFGHGFGVHFVWFLAFYSRIKRKIISALIFHLQPCSEQLKCQILEKFTKMTHTKMEPRFEFRHFTVGNANPWQNDGPKLGHHFVCDFLWFPV